MFQRKLEETNIISLKSSSLWTQKLESDCQKQEVFLAIRDNNDVCFYYKGGRLFLYKSQMFKTHIKYAAAITSKGKDYLAESELTNYSLATNFQDNYRQIKENCSIYSGVEAKGVSELYHKHSYLSSKDDVVVLDIEAVFKSLNVDNTTDRVDIVLFNKLTRTLQFVEAKDYTNTDIVAENGMPPKVIDQLSRYESQILKKKKDIISGYSDYIKILNNIFNLSLPLPTNIDPKPTLLIFGFDNDQKKGRLKDRVTGNPAYNGIKLYCKGEIKTVDMKNFWNAKILKK